MSPDCSVCTRSDLEAVNAALVSDESLRAIADRFSIPKTTLLRHREHAPGASDRADDAADHCAEPCESCTCNPSPEASSNHEPRLQDSPASGLIASLDAEIAKAEAERDQRRTRIAELARNYVDTRTPEASAALDQANVEASRADALIVGMKSKRAEEAERLRVQLETEQAEHERRIAGYREERRREIMALFDAYGVQHGTFPNRVVEQIYPKLRAALQAVFDAVAEGNALAAEVSEAYAAATDAANQLPYGSERPRIFPPPGRDDVVQILLERVPNKLADELLLRAPSYQEANALQATAMVIVPRRARGPWQRKSYSEAFE